LSPNQKQYTPFSAIMQKNLMDLLTKSARSPYSFSTVAKSTAGRENPELHNTANSSTPLTRAIFIRSLHTPKERRNKACSSMVACSGQGSPLAVFGSPFVAVFSPRYTLSPCTVRSVADSPLKLTNGLQKMNPSQITGKNRLNSFLFNNNQNDYSLLFTNAKQSTPISAKISKNQDLCLTTLNRSPYASRAFAKSKAECGNSKEHQANNSTPLTRAFFVRSSRTPKECQNKACSSMVACSGQGFALDCLPDVAVFHPVTRYRPTLWKMLAIAPKNQHQELSKMKAFAYSFLCAIRTPETDTYQETVVRIISDSEQNARFQLTADYRLLLPRPVAKIRLNSTAYTVKGGIYA
ncbi:TPA: ash family protein, partial [Mannheimia haemolytica]|nr:ash family protein [Mannheimia haemolytica]